MKETNVSKKEIQQLIQVKVIYNDFGTDKDYLMYFKTWKDVESFVSETGHVVEYLGLVEDTTEVKETNYL